MTDVYPLVNGPSSLLGADTDTYLLSGAFAAKDTNACDHHYKASMIHGQ